MNSRKHGVVIRILCISIIFTGVANVIRTQYLIPKEKDKEYIISVFIGAIINLIMNFILIPTYGAKGAAIGTICAEITVCIIQIISLKEKDVLYTQVKLIIHTLVTSIIMFIIINLIGKQIYNNTINIFSKILVGIVIYMFININFLKKISRGGKILNEKHTV